MASRAAELAHASSRRCSSQVAPPSSFSLPAVVQRGCRILQLGRPRACRAPRRPGSRVRGRAREDPLRLATPRATSIASRTFGPSSRSSRAGRETITFASRSSATRTHKVNSGRGRSAPCSKSDSETADRASSTRDRPGTGTTRRPWRSAARGRPSPVSRRAQRVTETEYSASGAYWADHSVASRKWSSHLETPSPPA